MKKNSLMILLMLVTVILFGFTSASFAVGGSGSGTTNDNWNYTYTYSINPMTQDITGAVTITSYAGLPFATSYTIPNEVQVDINGAELGGKYNFPVTKVGDGSNCVFLFSADQPTGITFGSNARIIQAHAFENCSGISTINFSNVTTIGDYAFSQCDKLVSIDLENITSVGNYGFSNCDKLINIDFGTTTDKTLGDRAFYNCIRIYDIDLSYVTSIGDSCFRDSFDLTYVDLGSKITEIPPNAFWHRTQIIIGHNEQDEAIYDSDFAYIDGIDLSNITSIGENAFRKSLDITNLNLHNVVDIGDSAFEDCIIDTVIGNSLEVVSTNSFKSCGITSFKTPFTLIETDALSENNISVLSNDIAGSSNIINAPVEIQENAIRDNRPPNPAPGEFTELIATCGAGDFPLEGSSLDDGNGNIPLTYEQANIYSSRELIGYEPLEADGVISGDTDVGEILTVTLSNVDTGVSSYKVVFKSNDIEIGEDDTEPYQYTITESDVNQTIDAYIATSTQELKLDSIFIPKSGQTYNVDTPTFTTGFHYVIFDAIESCEYAITTNGGTPYDKDWGKYPEFYNLSPNTDYDIHIRKKSNHIYKSSNITKFDVATTQKPQYLVQCNITYDNNGGIGEMDSITVTESGSHEVLVKDNSMTNTNYRFLCWNTKADGTGRDYYPFDTLSVTGDTILYAKWVQVNPSGGFYLDNNTKVATIIPVSGTDIIIADEAYLNNTTIDTLIIIAGNGNYNSYGCVDIGNSAFRNSEIKHAIIVNAKDDRIGSCKIGIRAFADCSELLSYSTHIFDDSVIQFPAFSYNFLSNTPSAKKTFQNCTKLEEIYLGAGDRFEDISMNSSNLARSLNLLIDGAQNIKNINVREEVNKYIKSVDGILHSADMTKLIYYPANREDSTYIMPDTVETIGINAFLGAFNLTDFDMSDNLKVVDYEGFTGSNFSGVENGYAHGNVDLPNNIGGDYGWILVDGGVDTGHIGDPLDYTYFNLRDELKAPSGSTPDITGTVVIDNTSPQVGDTLTATWSNSNNNFPIYTWSYKCNGIYYTIISNDGSDTLYIDESLAGKEIKVEVLNPFNKGTIESEYTSAVAKVNVSALNAPVEESHSFDSIVLLVEDRGIEYSIDGTNWKDSATFDELLPDTEYTLYQRVKETDAYNASASSQGLSITTDKTELTGTISISGVTVFNEQLSVDLSQSNATGTISYQWIRVDGETETNLETTPTYTLVEADIGKTIKVSITTDNESGTLISDETTEIDKASQIMPSAPTVDSITQLADSITVNLVDEGGYEYKVDEGSWQTSSSFTGLAEETQYSFYRRLLETATHYASASSLVLTVTTPSYYDDSELTGTVSFTYENDSNPVYGDEITVNITNNNSTQLRYQWIRVDGETETNIGDSCDWYFPVEADVGKLIKCSITADDKTGSISETTSQIVQKADYSGGIIDPTEDSKTDNSITLTLCSGYEYSIDCGNTWQDSNVFESLSHSTTYTFIQRVKETATHNASGNSQELEATTMSTYTVIFEENGGTEVADLTDVAYDISISEPQAPTKDYFNFGGWYTDDETFIQEWDFAGDTVTEDITLYAKWEAMSTDSSLSDLRVDNMQVPNFDRGTLNYTITKPADSISISDVSATTNDSNASRVITQATEVFGEATVVVTAEDSRSTTTYTINFAAQTEPDVGLVLPTLNDQIVIQNGEITIDATPTAGDGLYGYTWYSCDDTEKTNPQPVDTSAGGNNNMLYPDTSQLGTYYYYCVVQESNGDSEIDVTNIVTITVTQQNQQGTIDGYVKWKSSSNEGITVNIYDNTDTTHQSVLVSTITDTDGYFSIDVDAGTYRVEFEYPRCLNTTYYDVPVVEVDTTSLSTQQDSIQLLVGDVDGDGNINSSDKGILTNSLNYNKNSIQADNALCDLDADGNINSADKGILTNSINYNKGNQEIQYQ